MTELVPGARATYIALASATQSMGRMAGSLVGPKLLDNGLGANAVTAVGCTLLALILLGLFVREHPTVISTELSQ